jgi:ubiquinone/menaquinone biosynthesis C-methylase UbiE
MRKMTEVAPRSIVFDQAAGYYDRTRALPKEVNEKVMGLLFQELKDRGVCLEIGVGTGRFAIPLAAAGIEMVGIDMSVPMLMKLRENAGGDAPLELGRGDATSLPFRSDVFRSALAAHVLHLIPNWQDAARELVRVVQPGGTILVDLGGTWTGQQEFENFLRETIGKGLRVGVTEPAQLDEFMAELGAGDRQLESVVYEETRVPARFLQAIESNIFSFTWGLEDEERQELAVRAREWMQERLGDLEAEYPFENSITWRAYDLPA